MTRTLLLLALGLASASAWAVSKGGTLYVKTKDAKLLESADLKGKAKGVMRPGDEVVWSGAAPGNKGLHGVKHPKLGEGFTLQSNLSPHKPAPERLTRDDGKPIDAMAFASSGAATKALSEAAGKYAEGNPPLETILVGLVSAEAVSAQVTPEAARAAVEQSTGGAR